MDTDQRIGDKSASSRTLGSTDTKASMKTDAESNSTPREPIFQMEKMSQVFDSYVTLTMIAFAASFMAVLLLFLLSSLSWVDENNKGTRSSQTGIITSFFVLGLGGFCFVHYCAVYGFQAGVRSRYHFYVIVGIIFFFLPILWWAMGLQYAFYFGDVILLLVGYVSLCLALGYCGEKENPLKRGIQLLVAELIVCVFTLVYGMFLLMVYNDLSRDVYKFLWRIFFYPVYFEVLIMLPVRFMLREKIKSNADVLKIVAVVHAQVHISIMGKLMMSNFGNYGWMIASVLAVNSGKLISRSTIALRDNIFRYIIEQTITLIWPSAVDLPTPFPLFKTETNEQKKIKAIREEGDALDDIKLQITLEKMSNYSVHSINSGVSAKSHEEEIADATNYISSVLVFTEMTCDTVAIIISTCLVKLMEKSSTAFSFSAMHNLEWSDVLIVIIIQLCISFPFDLASIYINERWFYKNMLTTWREISEKRYRYFGFLIYGILFMGLLGAFYMCMTIPRYLWCESDDLCTCYGKPEGLICPS